MSQGNGTAAKFDIAVASGVAAGGVGGMSVREMLETGQLALSITATALGIAYLLWKWAREWRHSWRRERRRDE